MITNVWFVVKCFTMDGGTILDSMKRLRIENTCYNNEVGCIIGGVN